MSRFKLKAKKLIGEMREVRNRGNCRIVTDADDDAFIAHVQQVMGIPATGGATSSSNNASYNLNGVRNSQDMNNNQPEAVINSLRQLTLQQPKATESNTDTYPPEVALTNFNRKWRSISCGGSTSSYNSTACSRRRGSYDDKHDAFDVSVRDFHLMKTIGKGAFGKVLLVQCRRTGQFYAMKVMNKKSIATHNNVKGVVNEKRIMQCVAFPFVVTLHNSFKDSMNLYMIMEFVSGGDLFFHLRRKVFFTEKEARFYGSQIILALEYLHMLNVVYRDLKPENILICNDGYIKLTDFGLAKRLSVLGRTKTMLGTPEYLAPEIFLQKPYGKSVDWWAFGVLLFEMVHGKTPFRSDTDAETFQKIIDGRYKFAPTATSEFKDLVSRLLLEDKSLRLGAESVDDIKGHKWFHGLSWKLILDKKIEPPFVPKVVHRGDTRFFDNYSDNLSEFRCIPSEDPEDVYKDTFADF